MDRSQSDSYEYVEDVNLYLGEYEKQEVEDGNVSLEIYANEPVPQTDIQLICENGKVYLKAAQDQEFISPLYFQRLVDLNHCNSSQAFQNINTRPTSFFHFLVTPITAVPGKYGQQKDQPSDFRKSALLLLYIHSKRFPHAAAAFFRFLLYEDSELPVT